ncbi:formylglycine-generating enzyme family protein [Cereibacter azotoformans]|uniref:Formylglycine-generating enzyme required for sulfatase activity n=1 Tax=Cereibacter azotoformans TaxID=43057 RepID=A0A2T5KDA2_9RHOB|nr:formylglycine-generating enzyme family protein [Cereibacter azotoformans]PTR20401.1 formylglycine-generating enzyme required for sulfatase activity [Cereibacter azotoformans]UIJ31959.1 formylglycine-generating enzyme family protein [Cereibacter azotoformans]
MLRAALASGLLALAAFGGFGLAPSAPRLPPPETVSIPPGPALYRSSAEYRIGTRRIDPPPTHIEIRAFDIMAGQVTQEEYARCVAEGACQPTTRTPGAHLPQTGVNWSDATAYAAWLSERTGQEWRLPSDAEWLRAAAERGFDGALGAEGENPSDRWLASYRSEVDRRGSADLVPRPSGHFGRNSLGLRDLAGNVWEWTTSCDEKISLSSTGEQIASERFCGVRVAQGKHRAFMVDFIRDARSGGCAAGIPPDFLGFRLVRDIP